MSCKIGFKYDPMRTNKKKLIKLQVKFPNKEN